MNRALRALLVVALLIVFFSSASPTIGQVGPVSLAIGADTAISDIINNAKNALTSSISQLSSSVSRNSMEIRQHLEITVQLLDQLGQALIGKTFQDLNDTQKLFFTNLNNSLTAFQDTSRITLDRVDDTLNNLNSTLGTIPLADRNPRLIKFTPVYVTSLGGQGETIVVTVNGH